VTEPGQLAESLREHLARHWDDPDLAIERLHAMAGGASRSTWSFDAVTHGTVRRLVVRCVAPGRTFVSDISVEAHALAAAEAAGAPVPSPVGVFDLPTAKDGTGDGTDPVQGLVMERVEGQTIARRVVRDDEFAQARRTFAEQCGSALASIHAAPPPEPLPRYDPFERLMAIYQEVNELRPVFELAFAWLSDHRPAEREPALVHGDFRLGNLVVGTEGIRAVLDWEAAHAGDPLEDLGWLCVKAWRFGGRLPVAGLGTYEALCASYEQAGGRTVDRAALNWWVMFGTLRWGVSCLQMASWHVSGAMRSVELAAIGRRACENEWDLLGMLEPARGRP
jgi:aminoglycoside phosphotransferase (APT) family kinase protein